jgi:hypothetical protein
VRGTVALGDGAGGPVEVVLADGNGTVFCTALGQAVAKGRKLVASGAVGAGSLTATFRGGAVALKGRGLDLAALDDPNVTIGLAVGAQRFSGSAVFRTRGGKRVHP